MWLYETCTKCLQHLVDLFVQFYPRVAPLLGRLLDLLAGLMRRSHQSLAAVGTAAFVRLATGTGDALDEAAWQKVAALTSSVLGRRKPGHPSRDAQQPALKRLICSYYAAIAEEVMYQMFMLRRSTSLNFSSIDCG